jgi:hypothetical protein
MKELKFKKTWNYLDAEFDILRQPSLPPGRPVPTVLDTHLAKTLPASKEEEQVA